MNLLIRFFWNILHNLVFHRPLDLRDTSVLKYRVLPNDIDLNFHMNNGRYLTIMDIARTEFLIRTNLHKLMLKEKYAGVTAGVNIAFLKELKPLSKYELQTKVIAWDDLWFYIQHQFIQDGIIKANAIAKVCFTNKGKRVPPDIVVSKVPHKDIPKPQMPEFLKEFIAGEKHMLTHIKNQNRKVINKG